MTISGTLSRGSPYLANEEVMVHRCVCPVQTGGGRGTLAARRVCVDAAPRPRRCFSMRALRLGDVRRTVCGTRPRLVAAERGKRHCHRGSPVPCAPAGIAIACWGVAIEEGKLLTSWSEGHHHPDKGSESVAGERHGEGEQLHQETPNCGTHDTPGRVVGWTIVTEGTGMRV